MKVLFAGPDPDLVMRNTGGDRKPGVHLSDITKRMVFEHDKKLNPNNPIDAMVVDRGFTWEAALENALTSRHVRKGYRPDQFQEDGIWCSPDWINGDKQLEEWKATKKTSKRGFDDVGWHWLPSTMGYLRGLLKRKLVNSMVVRFRIWWMNGDYSYESKNSDFHLFNEYWKVDVEFGKRELEEWWQRIVSAGRQYGLLKGEPTWQSERQTRPQQPRSQEKKRSGAARGTSRGSGRIVTFPTTRT